VIYLNRYIPDKSQRQRQQSRDTNPSFLEGWIWIQRCWLTTHYASTDRRLDLAQRRRNNREPLHEPGPCLVL